MIKGLNVVSPHDAENLKSLEHHVWYRRTLGFFWDDASRQNLAGFAV